MARNRFEQVDEKQADAVTLSLWKVDDNMYGTVTIPAALTDGKLPTDMTTDKMPIKDAFRGAIQVGNDMKAAVVVIDPDDLWQKEWGDLYRGGLTGKRQTVMAVTFTAELPDYPQSMSSDPLRARFAALLRG